MSVVNSVNGILFLTSIKVMNWGKSTAWDKPNVQLYSKSNRFIVLGGSEKGKMGNYKCTESGKLFLELVNSGDSSTILYSNNNFTEIMVKFGYVI